MSTCTSKRRPPEKGDNKKTRNQIQVFLHFFGSIGDCMSVFNKYPELNTIIRFHGVVSKQMAVLAIKNADVLINIGNTSYYQLPSKSVEYVATGNKILNLCAIENDSTKNYLAAYPLVRNYYCFQDHSEKELQDLIDWFFSSIVLSEKQQEETRNMLLSHSKDRIADAYMRELI